MAEHTEGPLSVDDNEPGSVFDSGGCIVFDTLESNQSDIGVDIANCKRLAALWNCCSGIPTSTLAALGEGWLARFRHKANISDDFLDAVETVVGMGSGAWDCIDPKELIAAVFEAALPKEQGDAQ